MPAVIVIVVIVVAVVVAFVLLRQRSVGGGEVASPAPVSAGDDLGLLHLNPADFHIRGDLAVVSFAVRLPETVDDALADILVRQALEVVRDKRARGLPIEEIHRIQVLGLRGEDYVEAATLDLEEPGSLPAADEDISEFVTADDVDPLHALADDAFADAVGVAPRSRGDDLAMLKEDIRLTADLQQALRGRGVDLDRMRTSDLIVGLLGVAGYQLQEGARAGSYLATRAGNRTFIGIVDHSAGSYPELEETEINAFTAGFYSSGADRGLLFSEKYGPHLVYEKERRDPRVKFITRERLQAFVDSMAAVS